jgi:hypothetical protein
MFVEWPQGVDAVSGTTVACAFPFTVENIASGEPPYSIKIAHYGRVRFARGQAGSLQLAIDDTGLTRIADVR